MPTRALGPVRRWPVATVWAAWHLPLLLAHFRAEWAPFLVSVLAASILLARLDAGTGGSVLLAMLLHAAQNTVGGEYLSPMFSGADALRHAWLRAGLYAGAAAVATLWPRPAPRATPPAGEERYPASAGGRAPRQRAPVQITTPAKAGDRESGV